MTQPYDPNDPNALIHARLAGDDSQQVQLTPQQRQDAAKRNGFNLGGTAEGADQDQARFRNAAYGEMNTKAPGVAWDQRYGNAANGARGGTQDALSMMRDRANGIHTASDATANYGNQIATGSQGAMLRAGRGAGALAGAGAQSAGIASRMATDNHNNMQITNARDTAIAQQQLAQGYGQQRQQDASQQHILDARSQYLADLEMKQRGMNDQGQMGYEKMGFDVNQARLRGEQNREDANYGDWAQQSNMHEALATRDQAGAMKYGSAAANAAGAGLGYAAGQGGGDPGYNYSDPNAGTPNSRGNDDNGFSSDNPYSDKRAKENVQDESATAKYARQVHEAMSGKSFAPGAGMSFREDAAEVPSESAPTEDAHGRTADIQKKFGENAYFKPKPGVEVQAPPPGGDLWDPATKSWSKVPAAASLDASGKWHDQGGAKQVASTEMLEKIVPTSYTYKPGYGGAGVHYGPLAQNLKESRMGASLVNQNNPEGLMRVDVGKATMANLSASADLHQRQKASEARLDVLEGKSVDKDAEKRMQAEQPNQSQNWGPRPSPDLGVALGAGGLPLQGAITAAHRQGQADRQEREDNQDGAKSLFTRKTSGRGDAPIAVGENGRVLRGMTGQRGDFFDPGVASGNLLADNRSQGQTQRAQDNQGILRMKATQGQEMSEPARKRVFGKNQEWVESVANAMRPHVSEQEQHRLAEQADGMRRSMDSQFAPHMVTSDEVVKDDIRREGIDPQEAYASRVNELTAMAKQGHPEAPEKLLRVRELGQAEGLQDPPEERTLATLARPQSKLPQQGYAAKVRGLMGTPNVSQEPNQSVDPTLTNADKDPAQPPVPHAALPDVAGWAGKVKGFVDAHPTAKKIALYANPVTAGPAMGMAAGDAISDAVTGKGEAPTAAAKGPPPIDPAARETTKKETAPAAPAEGQAAPIDESMPLLEGSSSYTVPAHLVDLIGPENWALLDDAAKAQKIAAFNIHMRDSAQAAKDLNNAERESLNSDIRGSIAQDYQDTVDTRGHDLDAKWRGLQEDASHLANYHENPNQFWESRSTGQRIAGLIGVILGGFAQGMRGGNNEALEQLNRAQDKDIDAQRAKYHANKDSVDVKRSAYGMAMQRYDHDDAKATMAVRLAGQDKVMAQAKLEAAQHRGTDVDDRFEKFASDQADQRAKWGIDNHKYEQARTVQRGTSMAEYIKEYGKYSDAVLIKNHAVPKGERVYPPLQFKDWIRGRLGGTPGNPGGAGGAAPTEELSEYDRNRSVAIGGKSYLALNPKARDDFAKFNEALPNVEAQIKILHDAMENDDPTSYKAARLAIIEHLPKLYGFQRGPSETQAGGGHQTDESAQRATLAGQIPEYVSWKRNLVPGMSKGLPDRMKIGVNLLDNQVKNLKKSMYDSTFEKASAPAAPPVYTPKTGQEVGK